MTHGKVITLLLVLTAVNTVCFVAAPTWTAKVISLLAGIFCLLASIAVRVDQIAERMGEDK